MCGASPVTRNSIAKRTTARAGTCCTPREKAKVPYVTETLQGAPGPFIAASDYMKVLPESIAQWVPGKLVALGTDGFGRSENRASLRDFFEVDAKHIVLATLHALASEKQVVGRRFWTKRSAIWASIRKNATRPLASGGTGVSAVQPGGDARRSRDKV